jgi:Zn-dependent peptidase ImmA (M78 family)
MTTKEQALEQLAKQVAAAILNPHCDTFPKSYYEDVDK